jgi:hypothetical protein
MSFKTIGTCSLCGGAVVMPRDWMDLLTPIPRCLKCKAEKSNPYGPVIDMKPSKGVNYE